MNINSTILEFTKNQIKEGLGRLPQKNVDFFFRMYDHKNNFKAKLKPLLDSLEFDELNNALNQIERTLKNG